MERNTGSWIKKVQNKITVTDIEYLSRSYRLSRKEKIPNIEIRRRIGKERCILQYIEKKNLSGLGISKDLIKPDG